MSTGTRTSCALSRWGERRWPKNSKSVQKTEQAPRSRSLFFLHHGGLLPQLDERGAHAAFVLRSFFDARYVRVFFEKLAHAAAKDSGAVAVDYADTRQAGQ